MPADIQIYTEGSEGYGTTLRGGQSISLRTPSNRNDTSPPGVTLYVANEGTDEYNKVMATARIGTVGVDNHVKADGTLTVIETPATDAKNYTTLGLFFAGLFGLFFVIKK